MKANRTSGCVRRAVALGAAVAALSSVGAANAVGCEREHGQDHQDRQHRETQRIAASVLGQDVKITLTAVRPADGPYAASVRTKAFTYEDGAWRKSDQVAVKGAGAWFWYPLTGSGAVCEFSTVSTNPAQIRVSLLITPSIGCSDTESFELVDGKLRR